MRHKNFHSRNGTGEYFRDPPGTLAALGTGSPRPHPDVGTTRGQNFMTFGGSQAHRHPGAGSTGQPSLHVSPFLSKLCRNGVPMV